MEDDAKTDVMDVKRGARLCGGDRCGYLLVQGSHDGIHPVYYKTEIRTFFLLLQERGDVDPVALGYGFGV